MVLEQIYTVDYLRKNPHYAFLLGVVYTLLGLGVALLMFPEDPALVAVTIASILFIPSLYKLSILEEKEEAGDIKFKVIKILKEQKPFMKVYLYAFLGIFTVFVIFSMMLPSLASGHLFKQQLNVLTGSASFSTGMMKDIFINNMVVFFLCFLVSLLLGNGAIFLITWNASVWGTIFGTMAKKAALAVGSSPVIKLLLILISVFPHMFLEILAYVIAIIAGTLISEGIILEKFGSKKFNRIMRDNIFLLILAFIILILAAGVETFALNNIETYRTIIQQSFMG